MGFWFAGLTSRVGAKRAAKWGGMACLLEAARQTLGNVVHLSGHDYNIIVFTAGFIGASLIPILFVVAGVRLLQNDGWIAGSVVALIIVMDFAVFGTPTSPSPAATVIIRAIMLVLIVNGVRGALALRDHKLADEKGGP